MQLHTLRLGPIAANCYILGCGNGEAVVIDIGGEPNVLIHRLEQYNLKVNTILLTHGHYDHVAGVEAIRKAYNCKVYIHEAEAVMLRSGEANLAADFGEEFQPVEAFETLTDEQVLSIGALKIRVLHTPGHTPGGVCYLVEDKLFSGDTLFRGSIGRLDLGGNAEAMKASLRRLIRLEGDYQVYPGHDAPSTLDWERANNRYMRFLDE